jgi:hypothetical protein
MRVNRRNLEWTYRNSTGEDREVLRQRLINLFSLSEQALAALDLLAAGQFREIDPEVALQLCRKWGLYILPKTRKGVEGAYRDAVADADFRRATEGGMDRALRRCGALEDILVNGYGYSQEQVDALAQLAHSVMGG